MSRKYSPAVVIVAIVFLAAANGARAGVGDHTGGALSSLKFMTRVEKAQYYSYGGNNYCWYDEGWQGPGWYSCGDEWLNGFGWGGPYGWNGWGGGYPIRRHGSHEWRLAPRRSEPVYRRRRRLRVWARAALRRPLASRAAAFPLFTTLAAATTLAPAGLHGPTGGAPASLGFRAGGVPAFHGFGGAGGYHGLGGAGFQGGGGAFSVGGHGGGGHR